jgi:hypothetical protein
LHNKELYPNRGETDAKDPHAKEGNFQKTREVSPTKEATRWARMGPDRPAKAGWPNPFLGPFIPSFDLDDTQAIYSPIDKSHASSHLAFTAEERVELVV